MKQGVWWVVGAAVLVYLFLRPQRGKVGTTRTATAGPAPGLATQLGTIVDGAYTVGKELFGPSPAPAVMSGETAAYVEQGVSEGAFT